MYKQVSTTVIMRQKTSDESLTVSMHTQVSTTEIMRHDASDKSLSLSWNSHRQSSSVRKARNGGAAVGGCGGPGAGRLREVPMGMVSWPADEAPPPLPSGNHSSGNSLSTFACVLINPNHHIRPRRCAISLRKGSPNQYQSQRH